MNHRRAMAVAAAVLLSLTAPALAAPHNVRFYSILEEGAQLTVDGGPARDIPSGSVNFYSLSPGQHSFALTTASGGTISLNANLDDGQMSASRGRSWWCVMTGRRSSDQQLVLMLDTPQQCASMLAVAPENDDPSDGTK